MINLPTLKILLLSGFLAINTTPAIAQITPDNTLGAESSRVVPNGAIDKIDGGALRDRNLFHSFEEFNINNGQSVYFSNPSGVENILTRVTGGNASNILGTLGVDGAANLFLMNPNGILFGENARLDLGGSFVGTTASGLQFEEQGNFSATNPQAPGLLTVNPNVLLFNQLQGNAGIINKSQANAGISPTGDNATGLRVTDGKSLLLVGGDIDINGGELKAYGGNIELAGLSAPGNVGLTFSGNNPSLNVPDSIERADLSLSNAATVNVRSNNGGNIKIDARNVDLTGKSKLRAGIDKGLGTPDSQGGDIVINATGITKITGDSFIANAIDERGFGKTGDTIINTGSLNLSDGSFINSSILQFASGDAGNIFIQAKDTVSLTDGGIYSAVNEDVVGNGGEINIKAGSIELRDGASLNVSTSGQGNAGDIFLEASDSVSLVYSDIFNNVEPGGVGNGGNINITAGSLSLTDGSQIQAFLGDADVENNLPGGQGNAGNINVNVRDAVTIAGIKDGFNSDISSFVGTGAVGNGGNININAGSLSLAGGSEINAKTSGKGNAGNITVNARQSISLDGSGDAILSNGSNGTLFTRIINSVDPETVGNAGNIQLNTGTLSVSNGAFISSSTDGKGDAGNITINAKDTVTFDTGGYASSNVFQSAFGNGADIRLTTGTLSLTNGSQLTTTVSGEGNAGNIFVEARDNVNLDGVVGSAISGIQSSLLTGAVGKGGDIQITTGLLSVTNGAAISANTNGLGDAGNITINAGDQVIFDGFDASSGLPSDVSTNGSSNSVGNSGDIRITTSKLLLEKGGSITTLNVGQGNAGNIFLDVRDTITFDGRGSNIFPVPSNASTFVNNGDAGNIDIKTGSLFLTNGGYMNAGGFPQENSNNVAKGGNIKINARNNISFDGKNSGLSTILFRGVGKGGDIQITTGSLSVTNGAALGAFTSGQGDAGNITINARDTVNFDQGSFAATEVSSDAIGNGGDIEITADSLFFDNRGFLSTRTEGKGNAGKVKVDAADLVSLSNSSRITSSVSPRGEGKGGEIDINTQTLALTNGSQLAASIFGKGDAGNISLNAHESISLNGKDNNGRSSGIFSTVGSTGIGNGGELTVITDSLFLDNGSLLSTVTLGKGDAGKVKVDAANSISLSNSSNITSSVFSGGEGKGGEINIDTQNLTLTHGSQISAGVVRETANLPGGKGRGGEININASESVTLSGIGSTASSSGILTLTGRGASGDAGNINVTTGDFRVTDGALVTATTSNDRNGGDITINANIFNAINGGQVFSTTRSSGNAGTINLNIKDSLILSGTDPNYNNRLTLIEEQIKSSNSTDRVSDFLLIEAGAASGLFGSTSADSTGQGGSIFIDPRLVTIENGAKVSVGSDGTGDAGDITLQAGTLKLDNGSISAQTASTKGGDINLQLGELLLLRNESQISTTAGTAQAGGNGGNITINSPFIVAVPKENSDITANAFAGNGGNVDIAIQGIFGIQPRSQITPQSDITASSETGIQGEISITDPDVNPTQGVIELPTGLVDRSNQIAQSCPRGVNAKRLSEFYITGKGSLPPNPLNLLQGTVELSRLATLDGESRGKVEAVKIEAESKEIVEAQGFMKTADGEIYLVAQAPANTPSSHATASACSTSE